jgi:SAP domain-containing ribonucleoprotein
MADYSQQKVPDLKKILQERGLVISGNKADLIARLQEDDKKKNGGAGKCHYNAPIRANLRRDNANIPCLLAGEDEIDWDEDDNKATIVPVTTTAAAGGVGPVDNPPAVPNQKIDVDPSTTADLKVVSEGEPKAEDTKEAVASTTEPGAETAPAPEAPKEDFAMGLEESDAQKEAEKRAARAKRFGIPENEEAKRLAERAKKFGTGKDPVVETLDAALPERKPKRVREEKEGGRPTKRQTPDRRTEKPAEKKKAQPNKPQPKKQQSSGKITDDPTEKAKAEARAKRFAQAA